MPMLGSSLVSNVSAQVQGVDSTHCQVSWHAHIDAYLGWAAIHSGKENAHKHKQIFPVTARVGGGSPDQVARARVSRPVARGQKFMCCVRNPRNINIFVRVPGREDRDIVYVPNVYVPFPAPIHMRRLRSIPIVYADSIIGTDLEHGYLPTCFSQKIPAPIKIKSAPPLKTQIPPSPKNNLKTRNFMGMGVVLQNERNFSRRL